MNAAMSWECDGATPVLEEEEELTKHAGEIPTVDLVDDENESALRIFPCRLGDLLQRTLLQRELPAVGPGPVSFYKIFVGVRRVELHE